jgi:prepilin-type N-terminal cleavage/methylation domain-containing protein/prepilin-type processing-associated H-X9-DG protein
MRDSFASGRLMINSHRRGFTLVELLVVIGIVVLLMGLLFPALSRARRRASLTNCLARIRDVDLAVLEYRNANNGLLPMATVSNSIDSPFSPKGLAIWKNAPVYWVGHRITKDDTPEGLLHINWATYSHCAAPIAWCLRQQTVRDMKIWQCPAQETYTGSTGYKSCEFVMRPNISASLESVLTGYDQSDEFRPGYFYMGTWENSYFLKTQPDLAAKYHLDDFYQRNIAGLLAARIRTPEGFGEDHVVVFTDYSAMFHSRGKDFYQVPGATSEYVANFAFLDGHAESRHFQDFNSYLSQFHGPISTGQVGGY